MKERDIITFCNYFYYCTNIPLSYYSDSVQKLQLPTIPLNEDPFHKYYEMLISQSQMVTYVITKQFVCYGIVKNLSNASDCILIGPLSNITYSREMIKEFMEDVSIPSNNLSILTDLFHQFPLMSFDRFLHTLCFIHYSINKAHLSMEDIVDYKKRKLLFPVTEEYTTKIYHSKENQQVHSTYHFEKQYLSIIENGDIASLKKLLENPVSITPGVVADNNIRQVKNLYIATATLVTRAAIKGGMDMESAYHLSDTYIQQAERLHSLESIYSLQYQMVFDFTERVLESKIPSGVSLVVFECINYINSNTNQPITVEDVADHVQKSRSFISRKFKQELGFGINEFINSRKIEEAKSLLTYTDKSISEISFYLCFSSQSYFQNVFKKKLGITPNEYRLKTVSMKNYL